MKKIQSLLNERFKKEDASSSKMTALAQKTTSGNLTNFAGVFAVSELTEGEAEELKNLLERYSDEKSDFSNDLKNLTSLTVEVKAINNQAALLHGERIKKAQNILKNYKEGAFTAWLLTVYGNRQTPYNFLQYFEFYEAVSKEHHPLIDAMPRQAVYTLASRQGSLDKKLELIKQAAGKSKQELLNAIRDLFPLSQEDRRGTDHYLSLLNSLQRARVLTDQLSLTKEQRATITTMLDGIHRSITKGPRR